MIIICCFLSLIVSGFLTFLLVKLKKNDPFPGKSVLWMLLWGAWVAVVTGVSLVAIDEIMAAINAGSTSIPEALGSIDPLEIKDEFEISVKAEDITFYYLFKEAFLTAAIPEEVGKFIVAAYFIFAKKLGEKNPVFNSIVCCGFVALGFEMIEDLMYSSGDLFVSIFRGMIPLHFCVDVVMGYCIGKAIVSGKKIWYLPALLIPIMVHGIYDALIYALDVSDWIILLYFLLYLFLLAATVAEIILLAVESRKCKTVPAPEGERGA